MDKITAVIMTVAVLISFTFTLSYEMKILENVNIEKSIKDNNLISECLVVGRDANSSVMVSSSHPAYLGNITSSDGRIYMIYTQAVVGEHWQTVVSTDY